MATGRGGTPELLKRLTYAIFRLGDRAGVHVLPKHFYTPVPDLARLRSTRALWQRPIALDCDADAQLGWLRTVCGEHLPEVAGLHAYRRIADSGVGPGFGEIESQVLHCFIRSQRPERVVEVGIGCSTAVMLAASARGERPTRLTCIDPRPRPHFRRLAEQVELIQEPVQAVPLGVFGRLRAGDLLFLDSSHALKTGSELPMLYLEVVPRLPPGVYVHIHDITLPYLYNSRVLSTYLDWQESVLVAALLTGNSRLRMLCCQSLLHHERPEALRGILPDYRPRPMVAGLDAGTGHLPSSLWLQTV